MWINVILKFISRCGQSIQRLRYGQRMMLDADAVIHGAATIHNNRERSAIQVGANTHIKGELLTFAHGGEIAIGEYCYIGEQSHIWSARKINIGNRVLISHNVNIFDSLTHPVNPDERHQHYLEIITRGHPERLNLEEAPVQIDDDAWIGCQAIILRGVTIGKGAIVAAGAIVTKDVPPLCIVAGNPACVVRYLEPHEITRP